MYFSAATATASLFAFFSLASAGAVPAYPGYKVIWSDEFTGDAGATPSRSKWNYALDTNTNNELQAYTTSNQNVQLSGGNTVQFVPRKDASGKWTSGRLESQATFTPSPNRTTLVEAAIRFGDASIFQKRGLWPAFWMLGDAIHHGTPWPHCGELDIMETVNGLMTGYGTVHCGGDVALGGPCNEPVGIPHTALLLDYGWHTWSLSIDRTNPGGDWRAEKISWMLDGQVFGTLTGAEINDEGVWATLARSPLFIILNLAVGGDWPGQPDANTADGYGNMMEVEYVAVMEA
ncbi:concanavalin A-like lectin/glucanase domain-containing protein [Neurospora hispaniola]|uniref:Concanavalin A-like lectin/glucanase domain-containing protein n=1 Tax=Neurospora hispaniola TaxID=588809 RepID=A0AAJ0I0Z7_9PEZI|nr:concanavalin A-like lectin/glucanase domain-containing protein [Neurospora hispaniola]